MAKKPRLAKASSNFDLANLIASSRCPEARVKAILAKLNLAGEGSTADRDFRKDVEKLHSQIMDKVTTPLDFPVGNKVETLPCAKLGELIEWFSQECHCFCMLFEFTCQEF